MQHYNLLDIQQFNDYITNNNSSDLFTCRQMNKNDSSYTIIYYNKEQLSNNLYSSVGLLRSIILNDKNKLCCFSPPKSIDILDFTEKHPKSDQIVLEEFVEGTMVNLFWDSTASKWEISTRRSIGGNNGFSFLFNNKPKYNFRDLFESTIEKVGFNLDLLDNKYCYSFIFQHPNNRIVLSIEQPKLYLVGVYFITNYSIECISLDTYKNNEKWKNSGVCYPEIYNYTWDNYENVKDWFGSSKTPINITGVVIRDTNTFDRCKIRNPQYEYVRGLRNNQPNPQYNYLFLRKNSKVSDYLKYFPEDKIIFQTMRNMVHKFTQELYEKYVSCYIKKEKPLNEYSDHFRTHMFHLHQLYMNSLKQENKHMNKQTVIGYVNSLDPKLQMYSINYNKQLY